MKKKYSTGQRFICTDVTSYEIHTLVRRDECYEKMRVREFKEVEILYVKLVRYVDG